MGKRLKPIYIILMASIALILSASFVFILMRSAQSKESDSQLQIVIPPRQSVDIIGDEKQPELVSESTRVPEEQESQLSTIIPPKQSAEMTNIETQAMFEPEPSAVTEVAPITVVVPDAIDFEPLVQDEVFDIVYDPEQLQPLTDELMSLILELLPEGSPEVRISTETLKPEVVVAVEKTIQPESPPVIHILSPLNNPYYRSRVDVSLEVFDDSALSAQNRINRIYWIDPEGNENQLTESKDNVYAFSFDSIGHEGLLSLKIVAEKDNGLIDEELIFWKEDLKGPIITISSPEENSSIKESIIISGSVSPPEGDFVPVEEIASMEVLIPGEERAREIIYNENGDFQVLIDSIDFTGLNFIRITATDKNNHISNLNFPVIGEQVSGVEFNNSPQIVITTPLNNSLYNSKIHISGFVTNGIESNNSTGIEEFYWSMGGLEQKNNIDFDEKGFFEFQISTVDINHDLDIVFTALKGDFIKSDVLISLKNDNKGPLVELSTPKSDQYYGNSLQVSGKVEDFNGEYSEVKSLYWSVSSSPEKDNLIFFEDDGSFNFEINTADISGLVNLQFRAYDLNNNLSNYTVELNDGKKPPLIILETPGEGSEYGAGISISGKVADPYSWNPQFGGIESIIAEIIPADVVSEGIVEEVLLQVQDNGTFTHVFRTDQRKGTQKLSIKVLAVNGNYAESSITIIPSEFPISDFDATQGDEQLTLTWSTLPFITSYDLRYSDDGTNPTEESSTIMRDVSPPLRLSNLANGNLYSFVLLGNLGSDHVESDIIRSIPMTSDTLKPLAKSEFGFIEISWLPVEGSETYRVLRSDNEEDFADLSGEVSDSRYIDRSGVFGKVYSYKVVPHPYDQIPSSIVRAELLSEPPQRLTHKGSLQNINPESLIIEGDYAYVISKEQGFYIIDISDPDNMSIRGFLLITNGEDLVKSDDYIIIAAGADGFSVVNVSEPTNPRFVGARKTSNALAVAAEKDFIYIADSAKGIKIYSLSDPKRPPRVYTDDSFEALDVTLSENRLYVSSGAGGLRILDVTDPSSPVATGLYSGSTFLQSEIEGKYCYTASGIQGMNIYDISDPQNIFFCSNFKTTDAKSLMLKGSHVMIADGEGGLIDVDISDPYRPESFEQLDFSYTTAVDVNENIVLIADRSGLFSVESFQYGQSFKIGQLKTEGDANSVTVIENQLFIADHSAGIVILNVDDPGNITEDNIVYRIPTNYAEHVLVEDNILYIADGYGGIKIYSMNNNEFILTEEIEITGEVKNISISDKYIIAAAGSGGIQGFERPSHVETIPLEAVYKRFSFLYPDVRDILYFDNYIFAVDRKRGLIIIDFSNPETAGDGLVISLPGSIAMDYSDNRLYIAHAKGVSIYDISDKNYPDLLNVIETPYTEDITIQDTILYIAEGHAGLSVYDVKDHNQIQKVSECVDVFADSVTVIGEYAYIADSTGINIVRIYIPQWIRTGR